MRSSTRTTPLMLACIVMLAIGSFDPIFSQLGGVPPPAFEPTKPKDVVEGPPSAGIEFGRRKTDFRLTTQVSSQP